ncbi:uncharacterized protein [Haliotis cracherodii]|uniref:uncharacterized protein n=1 Tax=Haliotis cracherodii TaxID=6455 RepID=UPI0039EA2943
MKIAVVSLLLLQTCRLAFSAHGCHQNHHGLSEVDVIGLVTNDLDHNRDGHVTNDEFTKEFITKFDHDSNGQVSEAEFVHQWHHTYHDSKEFSKRVFEFVDVDKDGVLGIPGIGKAIAAFDSNGDSRLSYGEVKAALLTIYTNCP